MTAAEALEEMRERLGMWRHKALWPVPQFVGPDDLEAWVAAIEAELAEKDAESARLFGRVAGPLAAIIAKLEATS